MERWVSYTVSRAVKNRTALNLYETAKEYLPEGEVVDLRQDSVTFGDWILTRLESDFGDCLYVPDGFGHGFLCLEDNSSVVYNLSSKYQPEMEFAINLFDKKLKIDWPHCKPIISQRDLEAPSFLEAFPSLNA